jgi:hypothetical protein
MSGLISGLAAMTANNWKRNNKEINWLCGKKDIRAV